MRDLSRASGIFSSASIRQAGRRNWIRLRRCERNRRPMHFELSENTRMAFDSLRPAQDALAAHRAGRGDWNIGRGLAVASIMVGLDRDIRGFLDQYGTNTLFVFRWDFGFRGRLTPEERNRKPLTYDDAMAMKDECPDVKDVTVEVSPHIEPGQPLTVVPARYHGNEVYGIQFSQERRHPMSGFITRIRKRAASSGEDGDAAQHGCRGDRA